MYDTDIDYDEKDPYGTCDRCGSSLFPIYFTEKETEVIAGVMTYTGRVRRAVSHLQCDCCMHEVCVDDSFDGPWYRPQN